MSEHVPTFTVNEGVKYERRIRRLTPEEKEHICNATEAAINSGWDEVRIWPHNDRIWTMPLKRGRKEAA
jgi:hypothetical protein